MMWDVDIAERERKEVIEEFEKEHPNIDVVLEANPWDIHYQKVLTTTIAGKGPDVYGMSVAYFTSMAKQNLLMNLDPYVKGWLTDKDYFTNLLGEDRYPSRKTGGLYGVPYAFVNSILYYNTTLFDASALNYPDKTWDYEKLLLNAKKLTKDLNGDGKPDQWGFCPDISWEVLDSIIKVYGGKVLNDDLNRCMLDDPKAIEAIQWMVDLVHKYRVASTSTSVC
jgi:multiple sugar transport system substrate-binding protein